MNHHLILLESLYSLNLRLTVMFSALAGNSFASADLTAAAVVFHRVPHTHLTPSTAMRLDDLEPLLSPTVSNLLVHSLAVV